MKSKAKEDILLSSWVPNYEYWFNKTDVTEDEACLIAVEICPNIYKELQSEAKKEEIELSKIKHFDELFITTFANAKDAIKQHSNPLDIIEKDLQLREASQKINNTVKKSRFIKDEKIQFSNLYEFCNQLYEKAYDLPNSLLEFLDSKGRRATHFDHCKDIDQYTINDYNKYLDLTKELPRLEGDKLDEVAFIICGLEPNFAKQFSSIKRKYLPEESRAVSLSNKEVFFFKCYLNFLNDSGNLVNFDSKEYISQKIIEISKTAPQQIWQSLYDEGVIFSSKMTDYLRSQKINLTYSKDSWVYKVYKFYSEKNNWSLKEVFCLLNGINPNDDSKKIYRLDCNFSLGNYCKGFFFNKSEASYMIKPNHYKNPTELSKYLNDLQEGDNSYNSKKTLGRIIEYTNLEPPQILLDLVFGEKHKESLAKNNEQSFLDINQIRVKLPKVRGINKVIQEIYIKSCEEFKKKPQACDVFNLLKREKDNYPDIVNIENKVITHKFTKFRDEKPLEYTTFTNTISALNIKCFD